MSDGKRTARQAALAESKKKQKKTMSKCEEWIAERQDALETLFEACLESLGLAEKKRSFTDFCLWAYDQAAPVLVVSDSEEDEEEVEAASDDEDEEEATATETETEELDSDELESDDPSELDEESESVEDEEEDDDDQDEAEETQE